MTALLVAGACGGNQGPPAADATVGDPPDGGSNPIDAISTIDSAPPAGVDPATDGTYAVTTATVSIPGAGAGRTLTTTIYRPTGVASPAPFVIVSPGFQMARSQYASFARHLATWGFVVALTDYADDSFFPDHQELAHDVGAVIDWALAQTDPSIDLDRIGAVGHSLGGKVSVLAAVGDARIGAIVGWDPVDSTSPSVAPELISGIAAPVAVIGETTNASGGGMPCAPAAENFQQFYAAAAAPALEMTMNGADHMDWVDDPSCGFCGFCTAGTLDPATTRTATRRLDVAWLRRHLFDDATMDPWLSNPPEVGGGQATVMRK
jgi:predicted dienelactone hydrolase